LHNSFRRLPGDIEQAQSEEYAEAEAMDRRALQLKEMLLGKDHPETLRSTNNLASLLHQ
jgi:hypothetical protein